MDTEVSDDRAYTGLCRVVAPANAWIVTLISVRVRTMRKLSNDDTDASEIATPDHLSCLNRHRIAGITKIDGTDHARSISNRAEFVSLLDGHCQRLLAQNVEPGLKEGLRDFEVGGIWCSYC